MKFDSPLFDRIRVKPEKDRRPKTGGPGCEWHGCKEKATHRAPKGRGREKEPPEEGFLPVVRAPAAGTGCDVRPGHQLTSGATLVRVHTNAWSILPVYLQGATLSVT